MSTGLFGHKSASKSNPSSPPHLAEGRSQPTTHFGMKRSESEYAFPISDEQTTHWKPQQQASERIPNSHQRPPVYRYSTVLSTPCDEIYSFFQFPWFSFFVPNSSLSVLESLMRMWLQGATVLGALFDLPEPARYQITFVLFFQSADLEPVTKFCLWVECSLIVVKGLAR